MSRLPKNRNRALNYHLILLLVSVMCFGVHLETITYNTSATASNIELSIKNYDNTTSSYLIYRNLAYNLGKSDPDYNIVLSIYQDKVATQLRLFSEAKPSYDTIFMHGRPKTTPQSNKEVDLS
ncbi:hypothetical protein [Fulvivirga ligni]|uniref:hypothetical protein n=1 Tax=Fulvivirga ligni TaxID=2904246 RepID=UPI001F24B0FF|nr:hypothetical protein [Fulvivirga ligni]UII23372.1 hypothetical protein LVD16_09050 [Fulvivirga ligni]